MLVNETVLNRQIVESATVKDAIGGMILIVIVSVALQPGTPDISVTR